MRFISALLLISASLLLATSALAEEKVFGEGVSAVADTVLVSQILASPDDYADKVVRIAGTAVGVCSHRGCWINLASDVEGETLRVKVTDGVIVFPPEIVGEHVVAEGVFTINKLDMETTKKVCAHRAKQAGEDFDPTSVTECMTVYQVSGTGAVVENWGSVPAEDSDKSGAHESGGQEG